jgi:hypothetical protein
MCVQGFEEANNMRIFQWLEEIQKFSELQYGFLRNNVCTNNLATLTPEIIKALQERNTLSALFPNKHTEGSPQGCRFTVFWRELDPIYGWLGLEDWA